MKLNKKKISALLGVGLISALTFGPTLNTYAALTPPTSYILNYRYSSVANRMAFGTSSLGDLDLTFLRTSSGSYYNYSTLIEDPANNFGLDIEMIFRHSNSQWTDKGFNYYSPNEAIGSNAQVGNVIKHEMTFTNNTNKDYRLYLDISTTADDRSYEMFYGNQGFGHYYTYHHVVYWDYTTFFIPANTTFKLFSGTSSSLYMDAWYLQDLGLSPSYVAGYEDNSVYDLGFSAGFDSINAPNTLLMGFQAMVGILVNFALMIVNLEVFGVSLINVFSILALFVGIVWILKIIRG
jgi:hypothetical protein